MAGGICLIKEPITTLGGGWHLSRKAGLVPCERGFPRNLLDEMWQRSGFELVRHTYFEFPPLRHVRDRGGIDTYNSRFWTGLDQFCCRLTGWNYRYHRPHWFHKLAPSYVFLVLRKPELISKKQTFQTRGDQCIDFDFVMGISSAET